ncbi:MAG: glycosyltransferase [Betaproteobacteria bacterium]
MNVISRNLHVIEPTLTSEQGHCMALVRSLCEAMPALHKTLWVGRGAAQGLLASNTTLVCPYFVRRLRKLQLFVLYRRLLREPGPILATTALRIDLLALLWMAPGTIPPGKVFLYFHWLRPTRRKRAFLERFARRQPNVVIFTTTPSVQAVFRVCGFQNAVLMPYPVTSDTPTAAPAPTFRHVLFAGAARRDKGFDHVVSLVEFMAQQREKISISVQASADHYEKYDAPTRTDLVRLAEVSYKWLTVRPETLTHADYAALFVGGICLQPYSREEFSDRVSGVTLDALIAGAPVITLSRTWIARLVERFDAGIVVDDASPATLLKAIQHVIDNYTVYHLHAKAAGRAEQKQRGWTQLSQYLQDGPEIESTR